MAQVATKQKPRKTELEKAVAMMRWPLAMAMLFSLFVNLLMLTVPLYMLQLFDRVLSSRSPSTLAMMSIIAVFLLIMYGLLDSIRGRLLTRVGVDLDLHVNQPLFAAVFNRSLHTRHGMHAQALRDLDTLRQLLSGTSLMAVLDAPWSPLLMGLIFIFDPLLGTIAISGAFVVVSLAILNQAATRRSLQAASEDVVAANDYVEASIRNAEAIKAMGMLPRIRKRWYEKHRNVLAYQARAAERGLAFTSVSRSLRFILQITILGAGAYQVIQQEITPGIMFASSILMSRSLLPMEQLVGNWRSFINARTAYQRLQNLLIEYQGEAGMSLPKPKGAVAVERIIVMPPGQNTPVLRGVTFKLAPGESLGVIGPSGAGKSTLARMLVGIWAAQDGQVRLDGANVYDWNAEQLGEHIGYLPQDVELFDGTVAENIARFTEAESETIIEAAKRAGVHDLILRLPQGYDSSIEEGGRVLSAGQRQRIALARALFGDPCLVVLDEPNSNLDSEGEQALQRAIAGLKKRGTTLVIIAHRPATLAHVDRILALRNGSIEMLDERDKVQARFRKKLVPVPTAAGGGSPALAGEGE